MKMLERWQVIYLVGIVLGLLLGWKTNPWAGAFFIWAYTLGGEALQSWRRRRSTRA